MSPSRRALLSAAAAAAIPLAGCNTTTSSTDSSRANDRLDSVGANTEMPPYAYLRHDESLELAWVDGDDDERASERRVRPLVIDSAERADTVQYADVDGADAVREFVAATAFDEGSVFVDQRSVEACYRLEICGVRWSETDVDLAYSRVALPYDVPCEADAEAMEARFLRLPDPLDHDSVSSVASGTDTGGCPERHRPVAGSETPGPTRDDGTTTDERMQSVATTDERMQSVATTDERMQSVASTDERVQSVLSSEVRQR
jgi:hypothetical protein